MRLCAAWLQWGHTTRGSCSLCTPSSPPTHCHHFTALYLHDCRVLCHALAITALVLSYAENMKTPTPFRAHITENRNWKRTHVWVLYIYYYYHFILFLTKHFSLLSISHTEILRLADSESEEDGRHISWGEAANVIYYNSALISIFSNLCRDLYVLPERESILTEPWPASTLSVSHDRCLPWPSDIFGGRMGLCQAWLILRSQLTHH